MFFSIHPLYYHNQLPVSIIPGKSKVNVRQGECCRKVRVIWYKQNSIFPENALINIRTPKRADIDHLALCVCREYAEL